MDVDVMEGRRRIDRDHDLLDALRRGDPRAPDELVTRYRGRAFRLASGIAGNPEDAEDVVQDAFWTVVRKVHAFRGDAAFSSWLYRIVVNAAYQNRRRRRANRDHASLDAVAPGSVPDWPAAGDDPALRAERRCALAAAMEQLPAASRAVVVLREVEGRSNIEVAAALGLTAELVKGRAHRARLFLRKRLACRS
jgi:RNA polymerase sigma-70 factor (ECF subfamily)